MDRRRKLMWMREILDHLERCCEQWQEEDEPNTEMIASLVERDLDEIRRVCQSLVGEKTLPRRSLAAAA